MTVPDLLAETLTYRLPDPPKTCPDGTRCAITGAPIAVGYPVMELVTPATNEFLNTFRGQPHGWASESAARCFRAHSKNGGTLSRSWFVIPDVIAASPMINRESAVEQGRPCWSDIVRSVWPEHAGKPALVILTTNTKKRLWPLARVGILGERTDVYLYDSDMNIAENRPVSWPRFIATLDAVETALEAGFSRRYVANGLLADPQARVDPKRARQLEQTLSPMRRILEWPMAILIARKPEENE